MIRNGQGAEAATLQSGQGSKANGTHWNGDLEVARKIVMHLIVRYAENHNVMIMVVHVSIRHVPGYRKTSWRALNSYEI